MRRSMRCTRRKSCAHPGGEGESADLWAHFVLLIIVGFALSFAFFNHGYTLALGLPSSSAGSFSNIRQCV